MFLFVIQLVGRTTLEPWFPMNKANKIFIFIYFYLHKTFQSDKFLALVLVILLKISTGVP